MCVFVFVSVMLPTAGNENEPVCLHNVYAYHNHSQLDKINEEGKAKTGPQMASLVFYVPQWNPAGSHDPSRPRERPLQTPGSVDLKTSTRNLTTVPDKPVNMVR